MIKNDAQLTRTQDRLRKVQTEIEELRGRYANDAFTFWAAPMEGEQAQLQAEIDDYQMLRTQPFDALIRGPLQQPILLENIGELLARLRIAAKLTQDAMAERLGWEQPNLSRFESENYCSQTISKIADYAAALGVRLTIMPSPLEPPGKDEPRQPSVAVALDR